MRRYLIKNLLLLAILAFFGCQSVAQSSHGRLASPSGKLIKVEMALTDKQQTRGLSGRKAGSLKANQGMLFVYKREGYRSFWMPDTYFDLDIFFLNKDMVITHVERKVPHHPGRKEPPTIARTPSIKCHFVLEMDASSPLSKELVVGQQLKWLSPNPLLKKGSKTRP